MAQSEFPEALKKGTVIGAVASLETLMDFKYAEMCKHVTIFNGPVYPFAVVMNREKWNSLPKDVHDVMDDLGADHALWIGTYMDTHVDESLEWSKKNYNIEVTKLPMREMIRWNRLMQPLVDRWITDAEATGLPAKTILKSIMVARDYHSRF
jgi:TRAP-type transport system periplasmic protein